LVSTFRSFFGDRISTSYTVVFLLLSAMALVLGDARVEMERELVEGWSDSLPSSRRPVTAATLSKSPRRRVLCDLTEDLFSSTGQRNTLIEYFCWGTEVQRLPKPLDASDRLRRGLHRDAMRPRAPVLEGVRTPFPEPI
jgi:hypothetical protein